MVMAVVVNRESNGPWDESGSALPFGIFESEEIARELFEKERAKEDSVHGENDVLVCHETKMNEVINITHDNWQDMVLLSYWHCE